MLVVIHKRPILRAEWETNYDGDKKADHAQPHWHVYSRNNQIPVFIDNAIELFEQTTNPEQKDFNLDYFHFAMEASWHANGRGQQYLPLETTSLKNWLDGSVIYIKDQLEYLCSKI